MWTSLRVALLVSVASVGAGCGFFSLDDDDDDNKGGSSNGATGGTPGMGGTPALGGTGGGTLGGTGGGGTSGMGGSAMAGTGTQAGMGGKGGDTAGSSGSGGMAGGAGAPVAGTGGDTTLGGMAGMSGSGAGMAGSASGAGGMGPVTCESLNPDAKAHGGHCYLLVTSTVNYDNAKNGCMALGSGAHLATISSESPLTQEDFDGENTFVFDTLGGKKDTWIGLDDGRRDKENVSDSPFKWVNDEAVILDNFNDNEPNHYGKKCMDGSDCWEHCVFMMTDPAGKWNDELCETTKQYVCEWDMGG